MKTHRAHSLYVKYWRSFRTKDCADATSECWWHTGWVYRWMGMWSMPKLHSFMLNKLMPQAHVRSLQPILPSAKERRERARKADSKGIEESASLKIDCRWLADDLKVRQSHASWHNLIFVNAYSFTSYRIVRKLYGRCSQLFIWCLKMQCETTLRTSRFVTFISAFPTSICFAVKMLAMHSVDVRANLKRNWG